MPMKVRPMNCFFCQAPNFSMVLWSGSLSNGKFTKLGRFDGSTGGAGFGIEEEEDLLTDEVLEGDVLAVVGLKAKSRGFGADFEHSDSSRRVTEA
jgi:hypothetical protein